MKKVLCALVLVLAFVGAASAEVIGLLARLNVAPEGLKATVENKQDESKYIRTTVLIGDKNLSFKFYDSMPAMLMALNAGEIDSMFMPECVGEYVLNANPKTDARGFQLSRFWLGLSLGFSENNTALRDKFNAAIAEMTADGKLGLLVKEYISGPEANNPKPAKIEKYDDAETIRVAVTGDLPPIDYIDPDGTPAGYNTAILAELGRRLHMNIQMVQVDSASRAAALTSGRVDCVFWFETLTGTNLNLDVPEGIIITMPYFGWNKQLFIGLGK